MAAAAEHSGIIETAARLLDQFRRTTRRVSATSRPHPVQERGVVPDLRRIAALLGLATGDMLHLREGPRYGVYPYLGLLAGLRENRTNRRESSLCAGVSTVSHARLLGKLFRQSRIN